MVIWTTTPWTLPGNRAITFSHKIAYGLYRVDRSAGGQLGQDRRPSSWPTNSPKACSTPPRSRRSNGSATFRRANWRSMTCAHPLEKLGYDFDVPLLDGDHVTDDAGAGFVHTAPGHGREDFDIWMASGRLLHERGIDTRIPYTVDADGFYTDEVPGFPGARVIDDKGNKGDANERVIEALIVARRRCWRAGG